MHHSHLLFLFMFKLFWVKVILVIVSICNSVSDCEECNKEYDIDCPVHGPLKGVTDTEVSLYQYDMICLQNKATFQAPKLKICGKC